MPENNITLKLYDYLSGTCLYRGCNHNDDGICLSNNIEHLDYIAKIINYSLNRNTGVLTNQNIVCTQLEVEDGLCELCGEKMVLHYEKVPVGDTTGTYKFYECLNPKCK